MKLYRLYFTFYCFHLKSIRTKNQQVFNANFRKNLFKLVLNFRPAGTTACGCDRTQERSKLLFIFKYIKMKNTRYYHPDTFYPVSRGNWIVHSLFSCVCSLFLI